MSTTPRSHHVRGRYKSKPSTSTTTTTTTPTTTPTTTTTTAPGGKKKKKKGRKKKRNKSGGIRVGLTTPVEVMMLAVMDESGASAAGVEGIAHMQYLTQAPEGRQVSTAYPQYALPSEILAGQAESGSRVQTAVSLAQAEADSDAFVVRDHDAKAGLVLGITTLQAKDIREILRAVAVRNWPLVRALAKHGYHPQFFHGVSCSRFADNAWRISIKVLVLHIMDRIDLAFAGLLLYSAPDAFLIKVSHTLAQLRASHAAVTSLSTQPSSSSSSTTPSSRRTASTSSRRTRKKPSTTTNDHLLIDDNWTAGKPLSLF